MKHKLNTTLTALSIALGSTLALAQAPDSDRTGATGQTTTNQQATQQPGQRSSQQSEGLAARESGMESLERLAISQPDELNGKDIINDSDERIGKIDEIVRKSEDQQIYALISTEDDTKSAVKLSDLKVGALAYDGSRSELQEDVYLGGDYERVSNDDANASTGFGGPAAAGQAVPGGVVGQASPAPQMDQSFVEKLAMNAPDNLEGKSLTNDNNDDLGEIEQIVRKIADREMFAVVDTPEADTHSVVKLADLKLSQLSFDGDAAELRDEDFDGRDYESLTTIE